MKETADKNDSGQPPIPGCFDPLETGLRACEQGDWPAALASFRAASQSHPHDPLLRLRIGNILRNAGRLDEAEGEYRAVLRQEPQNLGGLVGMAEIARLAGDTESAIGFFQAAAAAKPNDLAIHASLRSLLIEQSKFDWKADVAKALGILRRTEATSSEKLAACNLLAQYGLTIGLERDLETLSHQFPQAADLLRAARQLERSGMARALPDLEAVTDLEHNDLILSFGVTEKPVPGSETAVLVFGGANHRLGLSFDIIQRILRPTGVSTLYLRDLERTWYLGGIVGLGRNFAETAAGLEKAVKKLGATRILAIANCVGCAGALRYGLAIGISSILAISPRLRIPDYSKVDQAMQDKLSKFRDSVPLCATDIRELYAAANRRPGLNFVYGRDCAEDASDALHMAGIAGVSATSIEGYSGHACLNILLGRGLLTPLLQGFVRDGHISSDLTAAIAHAVC